MSHSHAQWQSHRPAAQRLVRVSLLTGHRMACRERSSGPGAGLPGFSSCLSHQPSCSWARARLGISWHSSRGSRSNASLAWLYNCPLHFGPRRVPCELLQPPVGRWSSGPPSAASSADHCDGMQNLFRRRPCPACPAATAPFPAFACRLPFGT